jgi:hypothetical protein
LTRRQLRGIVTGISEMRMRILVTIAHYFKQSRESTWHTGIGSSSAPLPKVAALNAQIVALHRYFGARRLSLNQSDLQSQSPSDAGTLDIVVMTKRDASLLDWIGIDPKAYSVDYFDGPPLMLPFEAQRIMRDRVGQYDLYAYMEDDLSVDDPAFFAKIAWFASEFGPRSLLLPVRYEMSSTGTPAKISLSVRLSKQQRAPFERSELAAAVRGRWNGVEQAFRLPHNPHAGCYVLTDGQLRLWLEQPSFYDRDASWISPLESAATYAPGKVFGLYMPAEPDPWFLQIEHFGARLATRLRLDDQVFGEPLLLAIAEAAQSGSGGSDQVLARIGKTGDSLIERAAESARLREELRALTASRSRLFKALVATMLRKASR